MSSYSALHRDPSIEHFENQLHKAIPAHIGQFVDGEPLIWHEVVSDHMHLDVYCWAPKAKRDRWTLVTVGMAAHEMNVDASQQEYKRAELVLTLPGDWPAPRQIQAMPRSKANAYFWPVDAMKTIARIPYLTNSWLGTGHTTQAGRGIGDTYRGSEFSGLLVAPVYSMPQAATTLEVNNSPVHLHGLYPLYADELMFIFNQPFGDGTHQLYHRFIGAGLHEGVFPHRKTLL